jgi:hypothetical protein
VSLLPPPHSFHSPACWSNARPTPSAPLLAGVMLAPFLPHLCLLESFLYHSFLSPVCWSNSCTTCFTPLLAGVAPAPLLPLPCLLKSSCPTTPNPYLQESPSNTLLSGVIPDPLLSLRCLQESLLPDFFQPPACWSLSCPTPSASGIHYCPTSSNFLLAGVIPAPLLPLPWSLLLKYTFSLV